MRFPHSVGKDRLIFTFQSRALSNYRGYFPVCDQAIANYRGGGDRKLQGDRLVPRPECAVVNRAYGICWVCAVVNRAYGDENAGVGALCKRAL